MEKEYKLTSLAKSEEAKKAIRIAMEIADLIEFHERCRKNGEAMMIPWEE